MPRITNIAIDGPAGSGKSTVAAAVARRLDYLYVDTGAMYRAVAYLALRQGIDMNDGERLGDLARTLKFSIVRFSKDGSTGFWCEGEDLTPHLRRWDVTGAVPLVAATASVRRYLVRRQRILARGGGVVMEGRDIGTVVLPDAGLKFFLTADPEVRFRRREAELRGEGEAVDRSALYRQFMLRDEMDRQRTVGPLQIAADATVIDGTELGIDEVVNKIVAVCKAYHSCLP
jgi:cytidylate kinase